MNSETKTCKQCGQTFSVEPDDFVLYEKVGIPPSDQCFKCRWKYLLAFWIFGKFRKTKSDLSGASIITTIPETVGVPIYSREEWISDAWDPLEYGQEYNSSKSFFEQFANFMSKVPIPHQFGTRNVNSQWCDDVWDCKSCYLCRSLANCEHLTYSYRTFGCKNSIDLAYCFDTELSYDCTFCFKCYKIKYAFDVRGCIDSQFLYDCRNVSNCFMCWNLRNKQYNILNKQYTKEEYFEKLKEYDMRSANVVEKLKKEFADIVSREAVHRENYNVKVVHSTGNFLTECKNCFKCYSLENSEDCRYLLRGLYNKDCIDVIASGWAEKCALADISIRIYESIALLYCGDCRYSAYLAFCENCEYCFGCIGLRKKKYCILNKQYSEKEYHEVVEKIKEQMRKSREWGTFFPPSLAYSGYNLTNAQVYFPQTKEETEKQGFLWNDIQDETRQGMNSNGLSDNIKDVEDTIVKKPIICEKTGWLFSIALHELEFYRQNNIPLPRQHQDHRTLERFKPLTRIESQKENCYFCKKDIEHYRDPSYQKIACVDCYQKEVL